MTKWLLLCAQMADLTVCSSSLPCLQPCALRSVCTAVASLQIPVIVNLDGEALTAPAVSLGFWGSVVHSSDIGRGGGMCKFIHVTGGDDFGCQEDARYS